MKRSAVITAATLALLIAAAPAASQGKAQEETALPEIEVTGDAAARPHPQDGNYSERPLGCVEVVAPSGTGNELGGHFQARNAREGIPVIPSLNDPTSAAEHNRRGPVYHQVTPVGQAGKPGCNR